MNHRMTFFFILLSFWLSACGMSKSTIGSALGGATGVGIGSQMGDGKDRTTAMTVLGLVGIIVGSEIGQYMAEADQKRVQQALEDKSDNQSLAWKNTKTHHQYEITPINHFQVNNGTYCREYTTEARINGDYLTQKATACRQPDGTWRNVN